MTRELTNSARNCFAKCHRAYKFSYVDKVRPAVVSDALSFGTAMHALLEGYWGGEAKDPQVDDPLTAMTLKALFEGYCDKWEKEDAEKYERVGAEIRFDIPLMNPETGGISKTWHLSGKIDAIAKEKATGRIVIVEHKTTASDIGAGSDYWRKLPIDGQVSGYYCGAKANGYDAENCLYDVIRKPTLKPYKATPMESRKYTKDGKLYASQHEFDETPDEWYKRLKEDIAANADKYFARIEVARSQNDLDDYLFDMWAVGREIAEAELNNRFSRNPQSCSVYGTCEYFDVCTGCASIDDETLFVKREETNPELSN